MDNLSKEFLDLVLNDLRINGLAFEKAIQIWTIGLEEYKLFVMNSHRIESLAYNYGLCAVRGNG